MPGERFSVRLVQDEGGLPEWVTVEVGLDGFRILTPEGGRALRKYPLHHISRWSMRGTTLILFTKSPVSGRQPACQRQVGRRGGPAGRLHLL